MQVFSELESSTLMLELWVASANLSLESDHAELARPSASSVQKHAHTRRWRLGC